MCFLNVKISLFKILNKLLNLLHLQKKLNYENINF